MIRRLTVDVPAAVTRHWHGGDPFRTHLFNALSLLFPAGEQNFIDVVREFEADVAGDAPLAAAVRNFVGQEAVHRHTHGGFNARLAALGYRNLLEPWVEWRIALSRRYHRLSRLAVVAAYEHFTAVLGEGLLRHPAWIAGAPPALAVLWGWHAVEETEHRAVSFDVYRACGGRYLRRVGWYLYVTMALMLDLAVQTTYMLGRDGVLLRPSTWGSAVRLMLGRAGVLRHVLPRWLAYFKPGFHPAGGEGDRLAAEWLATHAGQWRPLGAGALAGP